MAESALGYGLVDADNHLYEPYDCCTRHIERSYADRAVHVIPGQDGLGRLYFGEGRLPFMSVIQTDFISAPGSLEAFFSGGSADIERQIINGHDYPALMHKEPRLELLDEQGIDAALMLPTLIAGIEHDLHRDVEGLYANIRSFNRWLEEEWGFGEDGRVFTAAWMSLLDRDLAIEALDLAIAAGARVLHLMGRPLWGRSPADPHLDGFWARVQEAELLALFHVGDPGYNELVSTLWGEPGTPHMQRQSAFQWYLGSPEKVITDTMAALVLHNLFGRFPYLKVASIENGSSWIGGLLQAMDKAVKMAGPTGDWLGGPLKDLPSEVFKQHVYVAPFFEDDPLVAIDLIGAEHVLFGSDYPHPEGLLHPIDFAKKLTTLPDASVRAVMRSNTAALLGLPA